MVIANVQHSNATDEHGTPQPYVELARSVQGGIDLDPFSSDYWNHYSVKARRFYSSRDDGFAQPWFGRAIVNPPGDIKGQRTRNVSRAWERLITHYREGLVASAVWIGFSLEQVVQLQAQPMHPLQFLTVIPCERLCFLQKIAGAPPIESKSPTHGNYITLLPNRKSPREARDQMDRFLEGVRSLSIGGAVVRPV